jgi:hypothetical protein
MARDYLIHLQEKSKPCSAGSQEGADAMEFLFPQGNQSSVLKTFQVIG